MNQVFRFRCPAWGAATLGVLLVCAVTPSAAPRAAEAPAEKERAEPPAPSPVRLDGIRYEAPPWGKAQGLGQNGGYVAVIDEKTGATTRMVKIYDAPPDNGQEGDKQDVFITLLALDAAKTHLLVTDERGRGYAMDLKTYAVTVTP